MKDYKEDDFLMLSGLQHFVFCRRQWALIHLEQQWSENYLTTDGNIMHEKTHDGTSFEKRKDVLISRGMPIHSYELGISGTCDVVEFHKSPNGINIFGRDDKYKIFPVEYKRGIEKDDDCDILQVVAQAMCLEEMFCCNISTGYLFYGEIKRRVVVGIGDEVRNRVKDLLIEMHDLFQKGFTPKVKSSSKCKACSLKDICLPQILGEKNVKSYIDKVLEEK